VPIVATLAPVTMSLAIWAFTHSVLSLLFAGLGPLVALAGLVDARRQRRRRRREEHARLSAGLARVRERIAESDDRERARRSASCPPCGPELARWAAARWLRPADPAAPLPVRIGRGSVASPVRLDGDEPDDLAPDLAATWAELRDAAARLSDAPVLADGAEGIGIVGPLPLGAAAARAVALQLAALLPPDGLVEAPDEEGWVAALPQGVATPMTRTTPITLSGGGEAMSAGGRIVFRGDDREIIVAWARAERDLPPGCGTVVRLDAGVRVPALDRGAARQGARELAEAAAQHGLGAAARALPDRVDLAELLAEPDGRSGDRSSGAASLAAPIGRDARDAVVVDLVTDGPHALVGGTTGSGKSELLVSWVLAMAHGRTPDEVTFLLVDFKGGAAFAPLAGMPHVVGILSDLDTRLTRRAIESLRAELLRRERLLADAGARSIAELPSGALARLVVVVDEFAAVVAGQPELHEVFADLAARGRSLGLHLVLCTQRPAGVVRDGVLANITLRIGLRMTDRGDSIALLGDEGAARLPAVPRGRAVLAGEDGTRTFQVAIARAGTSAPAPAHAPVGTPRPWLDPLPTVLPRAVIGATDADAIPFGLVDLPAEQRQPVAVHRPAAHGHLLVLGATGSGRTTALAVLGAVPGAIVLPRDPADAWQVLDGLLRDPVDDPGDRRLLLVDDLDLLAGRLGPDERHELGELLARVLREGPARGIGVVAAAQRIAGSLQSLAGLFGSRLLLRMPSREEHVLAGGAGAEFDPAIPPGAGRWRGAVVQVAWPGEAALPAPAVPELPVVALSAGGELAIVAARPTSLRAALEAAGCRVTVIGDPMTPVVPPIASPGAPVASPAGGMDGRPILLGDPDAWQADWTLLGRARRELSVVVVGCSTTELRAITRMRDAIPPLSARPGECWLVEGGLVRRALLPISA
jgi:S-DNA-T family DNA segregation ATPase FtsK/SpoIIIE